MDHEQGIAIIGLGAVLPDAPDVGAAWANFVTGACAVRPVPPEIWDTKIGVDPTRKNTDQSYSPVGATVRGFEFDPHEFGLPPVVAKHVDLSQQIALVSAKQALQDAGIEAPTGGLNAAVALGNLQGGTQMRGERWFRSEHLFLEKTIAGLPAFQLLSPLAQKGFVDELRRAWLDQFTVIASDSLPGLLGNVAAARVSHFWDLRGPSTVTDAACASSLAATEQVVNGLLSHRYDLAVTGGTDMLMDLPSYAGFCAMSALSPDGSFPFDERANGFVMGEGSVSFVLKRLGDAQRDGDRIYAVIRGIGASSDGRGRSMVAPNPDGQVRAMRQAYALAGIDPTEVGLIEAHGTATPLGDPTELAALREVFAEAKVGQIAIGSVKANIGHLKAAAGAAGMLRAVLALHHRTIPPHANFERPNPRCQFDTAPVRIPVAPEPWEGPGRIAAVSAFGFGGVNYHLVLEEGESKTRTPKRTRGPNRVPIFGTEPPLGLGIIAFGANSSHGLLIEAQRLHSDLTAEEPMALARACALQYAPRSFPHRIAFWAESREEADRQLDLIVKTLEKGGSKARLEAQGITWCTNEDLFGPDQVAFMSPGQGSQYLGMMDELRARYPIVQQTLDEADEIMSGILEQKLSSYISPPPEKDQNLAFIDLLRTEILQPAMLATDEALRRLISQVVRPRAVLGHSLGEYGACIAAGVLDFGDALRIVAARGEAMEEVTLDDNGLMLGVGATAEAVERGIAGVEGYVAIVNKNCPSQTIIGGATKAVQATDKKLKEMGLETMYLPVSHAFHSEIVAPASAPLRRALDRIEVNPPHTPILSNVTGDFYPERDHEDTREWIRAILARQVASPVEFIKEVERAYGAGCRIFLEVGPKRAQSGFVSDILKGRPHRALYLAHPKHGELTQLGRAVAALVAHGVIPYGKTRSADTIIPRPPFVRTVAAAPETIAAANEAADRQHRASAPQNKGPLDELVADPAFWQFVSLQGPAIINSLAASYQAAKALHHGSFSLPAMPGSPVAYTLAGAPAPVPMTPAPPPELGIPEQPVPRTQPEAAPKAAPAKGNGGAPSNGGDLTDWVLNRVADITGYQVDELDLDANLEAELGIDSIRQIEIILGLRDELNLPADEDFRVADFPNLRKLLHYLEARLPGASPF